MNFSPEDLAAKLAGFPEPAGHVVALSGGGDSTALLIALHELQPGVPLRAIHVCHQLQPDAPAWAARCRELCRDLAVPFESTEVEVAGRGGGGLEAAAREARYSALEASLSAGEMLLTGHHRDDQAETVLLQLLRGSGPHGMAPCRAFGPGWLARPLLHVPRSALRRWLQASGRTWVEDPDNDNPDRDRNFLRHRVMPRLAERWPSAARVLARGAENRRDEASAREAWARADLAAALTPDGSGIDVRALAALDGPRRRLVLRAWLHDRGLPVPARAQLLELESQALNARHDAGPLVAWPGGEVRRHRDLLHASAGLAFPDPAAEWAWVTSAPLELPAGLGSLTLEDARGAAPDWRLTIRFRRGGERIALPGRSHHTDLKTWFQEREVPPWDRARVPLIFRGGELVAVADWCLAGAFARELRDRGASIRWRRTESGAA